MSEIDAVFCSVTSPDTRRYVDQKLKTVFGVARTRSATPRPSLLSANAVADHGAYVLEQQTAGRQPAIPLNANVDISQYSRSEQFLLKRQRAWYIDQVNKRFPLLDGEHVIPDGDFVSYLTKPFANYPKGTVVLRRTTNQSVMYYFMREAQVQPRQHRVVIVPHPPLGAAPILMVASGLHWNGAAKKLADGLAGLLPPPSNLLGAFLITLVWPSESQAKNDWDEVYKNMKVILKTGLAESEVNGAANKVKGFVAFLDNEYTELKKDTKKTRQELLNALSAYDQPFFLDIVNVFMHADKPDVAIASASLTNFMLGANLHIGLNQERALIDPEHLEDANGSAYAHTAANLARTYAKYARMAAPHVKEMRTAQISTIQKDESSRVAGNQLSCSWTYWFEDANNGFRSQNYHYSDIGNICHPIDYKKAQRTQLDAQTAREEYAKKVEVEMDSLLKREVYEVADSWDKIAANPVPQPLS